MNVRPATEADLPAMAAVIADDEAFVNGRPSKIGVDDLREWISGADLALDTWLFEEDGELQAVGWCNRLPGSDVTFAAGIVHPRAKGQGIGAQLVDLSEARAVAHGASRLQQFTPGNDSAAAELFGSRGYRAVRRFYEMAIELDTRPETTDAAIESLGEDELRPFHAALDEAFQDHWEHHSLDFERWWARHKDRPGLDLSLWYLIRDGDELAAVSRNEANRNGGGYVAAIGVRRPWRGKGYAKALLLHTFAEFYERGYTRVTLGVDAQNPTGATHLYERVGMHVEQENVLYERSL